MKKELLLISLVFNAILSGCVKSIVDPCEVEIVGNYVPEKVIHYFPYSLGQKLKFNQYEDSLFVKEITFIVDTMSLNRNILNTPGQENCVRVDTNDIYIINLHNNTDTSENLKIILEGSENDRYTKMSVFYKNARYSANQFSDYVIYGVNHQGEITDFKIFGHNYGKTHVTYPNGLITRLYSNNTYGIIGLEYNYFKDRLFLKP